MLVILAALAASASAAPELRQGAGTPAVQATATVRIVSGARITAAELPKDAMVRETKVAGPDGVQRDARLVEFP